MATSENTTANHQFVDLAPINGLCDICGSSVSFHRITKGERSYHFGLLKRGNTLILQVADSADQLHCEILRYCGERVNTIANLQRQREPLADALKREGFKFDRFRIERVSSHDFSAGA